MVGFEPTHLSEPGYSRLRLSYFTASPNLVGNVGIEPTMGFPDGFTDRFSTLENIAQSLVVLEGIEPSTSPLSGERATTEPQDHYMVPRVRIERTSSAFQTDAKTTSATEAYSSISI